MIISVKKSELKGSEIKYGVQEIEGTDFVKWWAKKIVTLNGVISEENKFCGVCEKSFFENLDSLELPNSFVEFDKYSNKSWDIVAIRKSDMQDILNGKRTLEDRFVMKKVYFDNINSDEYDIYLYGGMYSQLLNLKKELVNLPIFIEIGYRTLASRMYGYDNIVDRCKKFMNDEHQVDCKVIHMYDSAYSNGGLKLFISLSDDKYEILSSPNYTPGDRLEFIFGKLMGLTRV